MHMMVRQYHWDARQVYEFFNVAENGWGRGDLPDPPNPVGLQAFMMACVDETISQMNEENSPKGGSGANRPERRRI